MSYPKIYRDLFVNDGAGSTLNNEVLPEVVPFKADIIEAAKNASEESSNSSPSTVDLASVMIAVATLEAKVKELEDRVHLVETGGGD